MIWLQIIAAFVIARLKRSLEVLQKNQQGYMSTEKSVYGFSKDLLTFPGDNIQNLPRTRPYFLFC